MPRLTEALQPEEPIEEPTPATAGSARTIASAFCCRSYMVWNDTSVDARVPPKTSPVSSCGKKPFGVRTKRIAVMTMVATITSSVRAR